MSRIFRLIVTALLCVITIAGCSALIAYASSGGAAPIAATTTSMVAYNKNGITVTAHLESGHFHSAVYTCEAPRLTVESRSDIKSITCGNYQYGTDPNEVAITPKVLNINGKTAEIEFEDDTKNYIVVRITTASSSAEIKFVVAHGIGKRDVFNYDATCTRPARHEQVYHCDICPEISHTVSYVDPGAVANGHKFEEKTITSSCEGGKAVTVKICTECGQVEYKGDEKFDEESSVHDFSVKVETVATCKHDGTVVYKCSKCEALKVGGEVLTPGCSHELPVWNSAEIIPATCTKNGKRVRVCSLCGLDCSDAIYATGHKWKVEEITQSPTCQDPGVATAKCTVCGEVNENYPVAKTTHKYEYKVVEPSTCVKAGYSAHVCIYCGDEAEGTRQELPIAGHVKEADDGDCTTPIKCQVCEAIIEEGKAAHTYSVNYGSDGTNHWQRCVNKNCTHTTDPVPHVRPSDKKECNKAFLCTVCGKMVSGKPHNFPETYDSAKANALYHFAVCQDCGYEVGYMHTFVSDDDCTTPTVCQICNYVKTQAKEHVFSNWINEADEGVHVRECLNEGCNYEEEKPHNYGEPQQYNVTPATCTEPGKYDSVQICEGCGHIDIIEKDVVIPMKDHDWGEWKDVDSPDCDDSGTKERKCNTCGYTETESLNPTGHQYDPNDWQVIQAPTCTESGSAAIVCKVCGVHIESKVLDPTGHQWGSENDGWKVATPATCTEDQTSTRECTVCHEIEGRVDLGTALGHSYGEYKYNDDASCQKPGTKTAVCETCGYPDTVLDDEHKQLEHLFENYVYQNDAKLGVDGTEVAECEYGCGAKDTRTAEGTKLHEHTFLKYEIVTPATCTENEYAQSHCEICGTASEIYEVEGTALGHSAGDPIILTPATCEEDAVLKTVCRRCEEELEEWSEKGTATGHDYQNYVYNNDAACETDGTETAECENGCGKTDTRTKPGTALEHIPVGTVTKFPSYTEEGAIEYKCGICGKALGTAPIPALKDESVASAEVVSKGGAPAVKADSEELITHAITESDFEEFNSGMTIKVSLEVSDITSTVPAEDKSLAEELIAKDKPKNRYEVGMYLDVSITKTIGGVDSKVEKTASEIGITVDIPESLYDKNRQYAVIRIHGGKAELLADLDSDPNTVTFKTDCFSTYALVYRTKPASSTHTHTPVYLFDSEYHWMQCATCGARLMTEQHRFVNGTCPACGYTIPGFNFAGTVVPPQNDDSFVEVEVPTEPRSCEDD